MIYWTIRRYIDTKGYRVVGRRNWKRSGVMECLGIVWLKVSLAATSPLLVALESLSAVSIQTERGSSSMIRVLLLLLFDLDIVAGSAVVSL